MARLIVSIACPETQLMTERAVAALAAGADVVELRLDALADPEAILPQAARLPAEQWLATYRTVAEGGEGKLGDEAIAQLLAAAATAGGLVDVEAEFFTRLPGRLDELPAHQLVVSRHDFAGRPAAPGTLLAALEQQRPGAVVKLAWRTDTVSDVLEACNQMRMTRDRRVVIPMGEKGLPARVLAAKFGAWGTFCAPDARSGTAPGQVTLSDMRTLYGWSRVGQATRVLGVIGSPVSHSLSPAIFNAQFAASGWDGLYLPWRIDSEGELARFLEDCRHMTWFGAHGFSVTLPHKAAALRVADHAESLAERIGAANTLMLGAEGWTAFNTDYVGALAAIQAGLNVCERALIGLKVAVLGAGGVARAVVAGLRDRQAAVTIYNRTPGRAEELAEAFECQTGRWEDRAALRCDLVVNCTSIGMHPHTDASPLPGEALSARPAVFDTVYNPLQTKLLREAKQAGCLTIDGAAMFVQQAAAQYRIWTGQSADLAGMDRLVRSKLGQPPG